MAMKNPVHPGSFIKHAVEVSGLNVTDAAERLGVTRQSQVIQIIGCFDVCGKPYHLKRRLKLIEKGCRI